MPTELAYTEAERGGVPVAELRLSSDSGVNPLSSGTVAAFRRHFRDLDHADAPYAVVLSAEGRCFCAGADVKEFRDITQDGFRRYMTDILAMYAEMAELRKPIIALVHADARGGGMALALFSDFVIAADEAQFALPEVHRGLAGGGYLMPLLVGKQRATEMVMLGRSYSAARMLDLGLVSEVCPAVEIAGRTDRLCAELGALSGGALAVAKQSLAGGLGLGLREAMAKHVEAQSEAFRLARERGQM
ncbi:enoyl-CoA hydratase/isomerase family protein [Marinibaculum pumilum]|uniref:Enoyl-CoA hydratase/isomerase family protein n=1 Tax=Marinibaculum pumilum TaxID=1766165 RepID=A0ABV7L038_9PROT